MAKVRIRFKAPKTAKKGEVIEIKTLVTHKMESGRRKNKKGKKIPRKIINNFTCTYGGKEVFSSNWHPAVSANPYLVFYVRAEKTGKLEMRWKDDDGKVYTASSMLTVG
ncbi:MAG: thiosulfate oxidation carrier complex protein SoxZ [Alphaproteobacteria bacterium]|jgi:sulfur-oxidizing protein SoxZ